MKGMYYRRKILLSILQKFGGTLDKIDLMKLLFLFTQGQLVKSYEFIPYKFGCYSYQANRDMGALCTYSIVKAENNQWEMINTKNFISELKRLDVLLLNKIYEQYKNLKGKKLIEYVYQTYPYYSIHSEILEKVFDENYTNFVKSLKPQKKNTTLFTIGYEGKTLEYYINQLIKEDIKVLCDIRKNPISMKDGFSKNEMKGILESIDIQYIHIPELGIESNKRKDSHTKQDYQKLFEDYEKEVIPKHQNSLDILLKLLKENKRIALTCFEKSYKDCHRSRTASAIVKLLNDRLEVIHL